MNKNKLIFLLATAGLGGCATHPLPENYSGAKTIDIVRKIQCEARSAVSDQVIYLLTRKEASPTSRSIGERLASGDLKFSNGLRHKLDRNIEEYIEKYDKGAIALEFTLDMSEINGAVAGIDLLRPLTGGALSLGIDSTATFARANTRHFIVSYTFEDLLTKLDADDCKKLETGVNHAYPIAGNIGLGELIDTFFELNNLKKLEPIKNHTLLTDTLKFTTTLTLGADTGLTLKAAGRQWQTTGAAGSWKNTRVDQHQVVVSLALPPDPKAVVAAKSSGKRTQIKNSAEKLAIEGLKEQRVIRLDKTLRELGVR